MRLRFPRVWGGDIPGPESDEFELADWSLDTDAPEADRITQLADGLAKTVEAHRAMLRERAAIKRLQRSQLWATIAMAVVLAVAGVFYGRHLDANTKGIRRTNAIALKAQSVALERTQAAQKALREYQVQACERDNERTRSDNVSHLDDFRFDEGTVALIKLALALPQPPNPNLTATDSRRATEATTRYIVGLEEAARRKTWKAVIPDCGQAVTEPSKNRLGRPTPFVRRLPPDAALFPSDG